MYLTGLLLLQVADRLTYRLLMMFPSVLQVMFQVLLFLRVPLLIHLHPNCRMLLLILTF